jgi:mono/diheme cytochrome c family protein
MNLRTSIAAVVAVVGLLGVSRVLAQAPEDSLPNAPGKDVVVRVCTACHGADQFAFARLTPDQWENEVSKMQSAGAEMTSEEAAAISAYLAKNLAKPPPAAPSDAKAPGGR